jgi:hypothetical protein
LCVFLFYPSPCHTPSLTCHRCLWPSLHHHYHHCYHHSASKHAVEGFSKALRQELRPWGLHVSVVNPGFMKTPLIEASIAKAQKVFEASAVAQQYPADILSGDASQVRVMQEDPARVVACITGLVCRRSRPALNNYPGWQVEYLLSLLPSPHYRPNTPHALTRRHNTT